MKTSLLIVLVSFISQITYCQQLEKAIAYYEKSEYQHAEKALKLINKQSVDYTKSLYYLGRISFEKGDYETAQEFFEEAIDIDDKQSDYYLWLGNAIGALAQESNIFMQGILASQVKDAYERAAELNPKNVDAHWGLVQYYSMAPGFMGGDMEKAEKSAKTIQSINKSKGHHALGVVYLRQEKNEQAERELITAAEIDKKYIFILGYFYQNQKKYNKAFELFENELKQYPENMLILYQIGRTSALSGIKTDRGIQALEKYMDYTPKKGEPSISATLMRLGMIYEKKGDKTNACSYYQQSLSKDPEMEMAEEGLERIRE